jgi:phenylacetic acid degradation operon negative regulatory protein
VHPKTEEFLNLLLWSAEMLAKPTFRNLTMGSYEGWLYRNGLKDRIRALQKRGTLEADRSSRNDRCYRLTEPGRLHALGGRDPQARWAREWDGRWRLVLFDVPVRHSARRASLRRSLREQAFGCLQGSVWLSPDPLNLDEGLVKKRKVAGESLCLMEAKPGPGMRDADIVEEAWDFSRINSHYTRHLAVLEACPDAPLRTTAGAREMQRWSAQERAAWLAAVTIDPLLPKGLLPRGYLGCRAWKRRIGVLNRAGRQLHSFQPFS